MILARVRGARLANALDKRAENLALDDHRIDDAPKIVSAGELDRHHAAGLAIDLDLGNIAAGGIGEIHRIVEGGLIEAATSGSDNHHRQLTSACRGRTTPPQGRAVPQGNTYARRP